MTRILTSLAVLFLLAACDEDQQPQAPAADAAAGKAIAQARCAGCHGLDGRGRTAEIPNLAGQPEDYLVQAMHAYRDGVRHHAALKELIGKFSESEIRNLAAYWAGLPPVKAEQPAPPKGVYEQGEKVASACESCHGEKGFSTTPGVPGLAAQQPAYLIVATQEYATGKRGHVAKKEMLSELGQVDIETMAMYFASQVPPRREPPPFGDVQAGEPLTAVCGGCHGDRGISPDPLVPNLAGQEPTYLVNAIKAYRDHRRSHEEMVTDKNDREIEDIAAYYSVQPAVSAEGERAELNGIVAKCERCHSQAGKGGVLVVPSLYGQKEEYLLRVMQQYRDGSRGNEMMHKMSADYSDALLAELAAWYATQPPTQ